ncbi:MAG: DUF998 domain-containing protein [Candidatus Thermoplasmatota archaeon]|nr:DUF998 domain-containing protein [Candidatus Thermoplasmatota archaeon]
MAEDVKVTGEIRPHDTAPGAPALQPLGLPQVGTTPRAWIRKYFPEIAFWIGVIAAIYFWVTVTIDAQINPWWGFFQSSFSALGDPSPNSTGAAAGLYWFYNDVVIFPTGTMIIVFSLGMAMGARNWIQSVGSSFFAVAGIFLIMVGIFHGGPPTPAGYHDFVSNWFFVQSLFAILVWSFGILAERRWLLGFGMLALGIAAPLIGYSIHWPSVATTEAFGIAAIDLWLFLMFFGRKAPPKA